MTSMLAAAVFAAITVDARIPAGNVVYEKQDGDTICVHQDLRDSSQPWFYWKFRVAGAAGRSLKFRFTESAAVGSRGPAVSTDRGKTWNWGDDLQPSKHREPKTGDHGDWQAFDWKFGPNDDEVWFCQTIPYDPADWNRFLSRHVAEQGKLLEAGVLCRSRRGRDVPWFRFGRLDGKAAERIFLSSRHHCGEATATFVLEGILEQVFADDDLGKWLRENVEFRVVPFADFDGVVDGDQGKWRRPHDHARDYSDERPVVHPEVRAIMKMLREWNPTVVNDFHCPWLRGSWFEENNSNEFVYQVGLPGDEVKVRQQAFGETLERVQAAGCGYRQADDYWFGRGWNAGTNYTQGKTLVQWALGVFKGAKFISSWEIPFANARKRTLRPADFRSLGRDFAAAYRAYLAAADRERIVFLEAHPDDLASEMGTVLLMRDKYELHVVDYTHGERGCGEEKFKSGWTRAKRIAEETKVCAAVGARLHWLEEVDGEAYAGRETVAALAKLLGEIRPRAVVMHWPMDTHDDHVMSYAAGMKAIALAGIEPEVYYHLQESQARGFDPFVYLDVSSVLERKNEIIACYECQDGANIAERKTKTQWVSARAVRGWKGGYCEVYAIMPGTVRPDRCIFSALPGSTF